MDVIPKYKIPVRVSLAQEETVLGIIFVRQEQRIIDMLCEQKPFFPINTKAGMFLINKSSVVKMEVLDQSFIMQNRDNFPAGDLEGFEAHAAIAERRTMAETI